MAMCLNCGTRFHDDDMGKHVCDPLLIPVKGEEQKPVVTKVVKS